MPIIDLPFPPSVNHLWLANRGRVHRSAIRCLAPGGNCRVATVVITGNGEGDRAVESPVKAPVREASNPAGGSDGEPVNPKIVNIGVEPITPRRRQMRTATELDTCSGRLPGRRG